MTALYRAPQIGTKSGNRLTHFKRMKLISIKIMSDRTAARRFNRLLFISRRQHLIFPRGTRYWVTIRNLGDDLASTWVAKPEVHAEYVGNLVNSPANYSCQRRQLRTRRLITGRMLLDWSRVYASRFFDALGYSGTFQHRSHRIVMETRLGSKH